MTVDQLITALSALPPEDHKLDVVVLSGACDDETIIQSVHVTHDEWCDGDAVKKNYSFVLLDV